MDKHTNGHTYRHMILPYTCQISQNPMATPNTCKKIFLFKAKFPTSKNPRKIIRELSVHSGSDPTVDINIGGSGQGISK